jgi:hypothetical protein
MRFGARPASDSRNWCIRIIQVINNDGSQVRLRFRRNENIGIIEAVMGISEVAPGCFRHIASEIRIEQRRQRCSNLKQKSSKCGCSSHNKLPCQP